MTGVSIQLYQEGDDEHLYAAVRESVGDISPWMGWAHAAYSRDEARQWVAAQMELARKQLAYEFAVWSDGRYVGGCGLNHIHPLHRFANLGYWVRSSAAGRGVAAAAVRLAADFAFRMTELIRLEIVCAVGNVRSQRVAEKVGAVREGVLRNRVLLPAGPSDAVMYSLVRPSAGSASPIGTGASR